MKFMSIGQKIFIFVAFLLVAVMMLILFVSSQDAKLKFEQIQQNLNQEYQKQFTLVSELQSTNITVWLENSISRYPITTMRLAHIQLDIQNQISFLRLNDLVENAWLYDDQGKLVYATSQVKFPINNFNSDTGKFVFFENEIMCFTECKKYQGIPILLPDNKVGALYISRHFTNLVADLNRVSGAIVTQLRYERQPVKSDWVFTGNPNDQLSNLIQPVVQSLNLKTNSIDEFVNRGKLIKINGINQLVTLIPIHTTTADEQQHFVVFVQDIHNLLSASQSFMMTVIVTCSVLLLIFGAVFYSFSHKYKRRLTNLVSRFPLIKEHGIDEFNQAKLSVTRTFTDELDLLDDAAGELAQELSRISIERENDRDKLERLAMFDELTELPNRNMLNEHLKRSIIRMKRHKHYFAVMVMDIDDFKKINDAQGHNIGDIVLQEVSIRLKNILREVDLVCRFGGDEFVIVVDDVSTQRDCDIIARKVLSYFEQVFLCNKNEYYVTVSLGVTLCTSVVLNGDEIIRQADTAMYRAKEEKGNTYRLYDEELNQQVQRKIELEREARFALANEDFFLALQPLIDMQTNYLYGFEALLRWRHREKGLISPAEFIPILENSNFMVQLDYYVIDQCIKTLQKLTQLGYNKQTIAINLSAVQFLDPNLTEYLKDKLEAANIEPYRIELELTETTLVSDVNSTTRIMRELRDLGVKVSIDDFGTGYSSLSYLSSMPVSKIKIDRSFVNGIMDNERDKQIVRSTVAMVKNIGMKVVAEGIETIEQYNMLRDLRCDLAQGYYISRPVPVHQIEQLLAKSFIDKVWYLPQQSKIAVHYFK